MNMLPPLLYRGSVKNIRGEVSAPNLLFEFSDRYSVFDWGEMPDQLEGKGLALAIMGKSFFQYLGNPQNWIELFQSEILPSTFDNSYLESLKNSHLYEQYCQKGVNHHALLDYDEQYRWNSPYLKVKKISILKPTIAPDNSYCYEQYRQGDHRPVNTLVPLEVIFRLGLPPGNSLSKRLGSNFLLWQQFGQEVVPSSEVILKKPILDFSTKLEKGDRYLTYAEAQEIAGLTFAEWHELQVMTHLIALNLFVFHHKMGIELWDGKIELAFIENQDGTRSFMLVDSIGIDELRLLYKGKSFSKEFLREAYKNSDWYAKLLVAKKESLSSGMDFKKICLEHYRSEPEKLDTLTKERALAVYKSYCNEVSAVMGHEKNFEQKYNLETYALRYL